MARTTSGSVNAFNGSAYAVNAEQLSYSAMVAGLVVLTQDRGTPDERIYRHPSLVISRQPQSNRVRFHTVGNPTADQVEAFVRDAAALVSAGAAVISTEDGTSRSLIIVDGEVSFGDFTPAPTRSASPSFSGPNR